jgi:serpin B
VKPKLGVNFLTVCLTVFGLAIFWWQKQFVANGASFSTNSDFFNVEFAHLPVTNHSLLPSNLANPVSLPQSRLIALQANSYQSSRQGNQSLINPQIVAANTRFSLKLFSQIQKQQANQNIFISPTSIGVALSIAYNGSNGQTRQAIARTLELPEISIQEVNRANAILKNQLQESSSKSQISLANSLWISKQETIKQDFIQTIQKYYQAEIQTIDFREAKAAATINSWVNRSTKGKIDKIIENIEPDTVFLLLNAIYFQGNWKSPFLKESTIDHPFILANGSSKSVKMMFTQIPGLKYQENELFQAISLPYSDNRLSMYIFLPNKTLGLRGFYQNLNHKNWEKWMEQFNSDELGNDYSQAISIGLPRFKLNYEIDLIDAFKALGMQIAFSNNADFSAMIAPPLSISKFKHKAFMEANEEGTTAAATTVAGGTRGLQTQIIFDRPFFCVISDNQTGTILFMGSVVDPQ